MNYCFCVSGGCKEHPKGFRVLSTRKYREHQKVEALLPIADLHAHVDTDQSLDDIRKELMRYKEGNFHPSTVTFQTKVDAAQPITSARLVLIPHDTANHGLLAYEKWHEESIEFLKTIPESASNLPVQSVSLIEELLAFYSHILGKIEVELKSRSQPENDIEGDSTHATSLLDSTIVNHVKNHRYLYPVPTPTGDSLSGQSPAHNLCRTSQLVWIDNMAKEIHNQKAISPLRRTELLDGLEEHRGNVKNELDREIFRRRYPHLAVRAIIKNVYKPILIFGHAVVLIAMMIVSLKLFHHVSRRSLSEILWGMQNALTGFKLSNKSKPINKDPRTYEKVFDLNFQEEIFAVCPQCASTHPLDAQGSPLMTKCNSPFGTNGQGCEGTLIHEENGKKRPILTFRYQKFDDWLHNLLSRPGIIQTVDQCWEKTQGQAQDPASDFWGGQFIREMKSPDGQGLFRDVPKGETRLLFSLAIDWFNPYHNKIAGKSASVGIVVMTCLNLPPEDRYKDQNIYLVGVLPGPTQQSQLNSILGPLITALIGLWQSGIYFIGIPGHENPRLIKGALVQLICDLPAARKVAGFPGHTATHNCSVCLINHKEISDIGSLHGNFMARSYEQHIEHAREYKRILETEGKKAAELFLKKNRGGVRWSVLNELPYWDPIKCVVLDAMHLILLGLCQFHWRRFWNADLISKRSSKAANRLTKLHPVPGPLQSAEEDSVRAQSKVVSGAVSEKLTSFIQEEDISGTDEDGSYFSEAGNMSSTSNDVDGDKESGKTCLTAEKMNFLRRQWVYGTREQLQRLTASETLCLLKENAGSLPQSRAKKPELVNLLIACRERFSHLPRTPLRRRAKASTMTRMQETEEIRGQPTVKSPSELLLGDTKAFKVPVLSPDPATTSFITRQQLDEVQNDVRNIIVPSWFTKIRPTFGEKANGKLKADEWRSVFTVYLPMTFLRLWAESSSHRIQLKALLCLTILVNIVTSKTSSVSSRELYDSTIRTYLKFLHEANPRCSFVINHHIALHLTGFMALHGPCHSHWAFPFERIIGKLQRTLHNSRMGDIPGILSKSFASGTILQALYQQGVHSAVYSLWNRPNEPHPPKETRVALTSQQKLQIEALYGPTATWATNLPELILDGVKYRCTRKDDANGDTNIGYLTSQAPIVYVVGQIERILKVKTVRNASEETVLIVRRYKAPPARFSTKVWDDIFSHRALGLRIVGESTQTVIEIVPLRCLIGHIAVNRLERAYGVALMTLQLSKDLHARRRIPE